MAHDNPPAFPVNPKVNPGDPNERAWSGMTLRDWFAGQALAGFCAAPDIKDGRPAVMAQQSYVYAGHMLAERVHTLPAALSAPPLAEGTTNGDDGAVSVEVQ